MASAVEEFRNASRAEVEPGDEDRQFYRLTPGKKMIVMLGGPTMNLLIYLVLTVILLSTLGTRHDDATTTVSAVVKCVVPANSSQAANGSCPANATPAPAYNVLQPGDVIVAIDGTRIDEMGRRRRHRRAIGREASVDDHPAQRVEQQLSITPVRNLKYVGSTHEDEGSRLSRRVAADPQLLRCPAGNPGAGIHR